MIDTVQDKAANSDSCRYDLLCIGNAIVDVLANSTPEFLAQQKMAVGSMTLIDQARTHELHDMLVVEREMGGGSAANTAVVASLMGARASFLGKVGDDAAGRKFAEDLRQCGIHFPSLPLAHAHATQAASTARCFVLVTPDGQRTMNTYLGACTAFGPDDVDADVVAASKVTYLEGYLFDPPHAQRAFYHAASIAHDAGRKVSLSLSDPFCVARHRAAFRDLVAGHIDILFGNEEEICSLYETKDFESAAEHAARDCHLVALTRSQHGSVIFSEGRRVNIASVPTEVIDTTGAGDAYAAGFLAGWTSGQDLEKCGRLGSVAASEVISHFGARPIADLGRELEA